jgi:hypothetical protein
MFVCTNLRAVPACDTHVSSDVREAGDLALVGPTVLGDEAVGTVGARE